MAARACCTFTLLHQMDLQAVAHRTERQFLVDKYTCILLCPSAYSYMNVDTNLPRCVGSTVYD